MGRERDVSLCRVFFRNIPTKTTTGTGGFSQVEGQSWRGAWLEAPKGREMPLLSAPQCVSGSEEGAELAHTRDHWALALPVPSQLSQTGTAGGDRQGVTAHLPLRAGNGSSCSSRGSGARFFVTVVTSRSSILTALLFHEPHSATVTLFEEDLISFSVS